MAKSLDDDLEVVRELANVLADTGLTEIELEKGGLKLRVARQMNATVVEAPVMQHAMQAAAPMAAAPAAAPAVEGPAPMNGEAVRSPMVGTAYLAPAPGSDDFISVGSQVKAGDTLLIVEAMKTMNHIKAPRDGKVVEILARNAEPVEYDEPLVILEA